MSVKRQRRRHPAVLDYDRPKAPLGDGFYLFSCFAMGHLSLKAFKAILRHRYDDPLLINLHLKTPCNIFLS